MSDSPLVNQYDYRNCQSLFGYAAAVHQRSGGICQLCGAGSNDLDFDLWRQLTVEHLIGESQGGYLRQISAALAQRFPGMSPTSLTALARRIDAANTITACSFCNSTTSRNRAPVAMTEAIQRAPDGSAEDIYEHVAADLQAILATKRSEARWKLEAVRKAFDSLVVPSLLDARAALGVSSSHGSATRFGVWLLPTARHQKRRISRWQPAIERRCGSEALITSSTWLGRPQVRNSRSGSLAVADPRPTGG